MDSDLLCSLDKLLLQFAFHLEKDSQTLKHEKEQIQICTANILEKKQQANILNENINKLEDELSRSIKQSKQNRDNCEAWKPTYLLFVKHEENLQEQLQNLQFVSEKDRKMYQEHVNQYREILKQYQTQYSESTMALEYHKKKAEMDELQNCVWAYTKKCKQQECTLMQLLEPAPFRSLRDWTLEIASLRVNTEEMLKKITSIKSNSSRLEKENAELQKEIQHFLKLSTISRQNEVSDLNNEEKNISEVKERPPFNIHEEKENLILSEKENLKQSRLPVLPMIPQKLVHPLQSFKLSWQSELEKEKSLQQSKIVESNSRRFSSIESEKQETTPLCGSSKKEITHVETLITVRDRRKEHEEQKWTRDHLLVIQKKKIDSTENNNLQYFQTPVMAVVREENQLRQIPSQRQTNPQQWFNNTPTASGNTEPAFPTQVTVCRSIELASNSQDERLDSTNTDNLDVNADENQQMLEASQEYCGSKDEHEFNNISDFQKNTNTGCEETASKSPFSFTMVSTPKSPAFDLFSPSGFGTTNTPDQMDVSYTSENINISLHSPQKDLGNIFGKTAVEDDYGFAFTSEPSSHTFATRKDYFNFPFSFGQDQGGASQSSGFKDFQSSQSTKQFTFF